MSERRYEECPNYNYGVRWVRNIPDMTGGTMNGGIRWGCQKCNLQISTTRNRLKINIDDFDVNAGSSCNGGENGK